MYSFFSQQPSKESTAFEPPWIYHIRTQKQATKNSFSFNRFSKCFFFFLQQPNAHLEAWGSGWTWRSPRRRRPWFQVETPSSGPSNSFNFQKVTNSEAHRPEMLRERGLWKVAFRVIWGHTILRSCVCIINTGTANKNGKRRIETIRTTSFLDHPTMCYWCGCWVLTLGWFHSDPSKLICFRSKTSWCFV